MFSSAIPSVSLGIPSSAQDHGKFAAYLTEAMTDPKMALSQEPNEAASQLALRTDMTYFDWMNLPENAARRKKFGIAMAATTNYSNDPIVYDGPWHAVDLLNLIG